MDANELLEQLKSHGFSVSIPVDIEKIAELINVSIVEHPDLMQENLVARLNVESDSSVILISPCASEKRKRFIVAHMIGHLLLHVSDSDSVFVDVEENISPYAYWDKKEMQANNFAMNLLAPPHLVRKEVKSMVSDIQNKYGRKPTDDELTQLIASRFQIPLPVAKHKLIITGITNPDAGKFLR